MNQPVIEVFADIVCPFAHVGIQRLVSRRAELGRGDIPLHIRAFPLEVINGAPMDPAAVERKVADLRRQVSPELFAGFDPAQFPSTSLPGLALTNAAYRKDLVTGERVALRLRQLAFDEGVDIGQADVLAALAAEYGIDGGSTQDDAAVLADLEESKQRGVVGSPHFFTPSGESLFCPTLELSKAGDHLDISVDLEHFGQLVESCFDGVS